MFFKIWVTKLSQVNSFLSLIILFTILFLSLLIIGNGCGIFGGVRLYEGASGKKEEGDTTKKKVKKI
mgnify:CR=1 FL=1